MFFHVDYRERFAVYQRNRNGLHGDIALCAEELCSSQRGAHFIASEPCGPGGILASLQDHAANTTPRPIRMNEECTNFCGIAKRVQQRILAAGPVIAAIKSLALAPA